MNLNIRYGAGVGIVVCLAGSALFLLPRQSEPAVIVPHTVSNVPPSVPQPEKSQKLAVDNAVHLSGTITPAAQASLGVVQPGRITAVLVRSGANVAAGETVIQIDPSISGSQETQAVAGTAAARAQLVLSLDGLRAAHIKSEGDVEQAMQSLAQARSALRQADEGVSAAETQQQAELVGAQVNVSKAALGVTQAKQALQALEKIAAVGGASVMDVAGAKDQYSSAKQDLRAAQAQLQALNAGNKSGSPFRIAHAIQLQQQARQGVAAATKGLRLAQQGAAVAKDAAQAQVAAALAGVAQARAGQSSATAAAAMNEIVSPIAGVVTSIAVHVGEIAQPGMALATVVATGNPGAEALAPARDLPRLHVGAVAYVDVAGFKPVRAVVSWISPVASPDGRDFRVKFSLVNAPSHLPPALGAEITVD